MNDEFEDIEEELDEVPSFLANKRNRPSVDHKIKKLLEANMVKINDNFFISKFPVTQNLYERVMECNPSEFKDESQTSETWEGLPVENVTFEDALAFCTKLNELCNYGKEDGFRLPTEKEWKYVANGGFMKPLKKYAGSDNQNAVAWYKINSKLQTHVVGEKRGVSVGDGTVFDMSGNVWEWCQSEDGSEAVCYGGSYEDDEAMLRLGEALNRRIYSRNEGKPSVGFRICVNFL